MNNEPEPIEDYEDEVSGLCPICSTELRWAKCNVCDGDGMIERDTLPTDDPVRCAECYGDGGWPYCPNAFCRWVSN